MSIISTATAKNLDNPHKKPPGVCPGVCNFIIWWRLCGPPDRQQQAQRESNMTIGLIVGAIAGAAVGSVSGDAGDGAVVGGTMGALEGGLADTDYDPVTSPRKIVDRCMKNRGYELLSDLGKGM